MNEYLQVTTTLGTREEAASMARMLVESRLAACAQVIGPVLSTYWWEGRIEEGEEWQCVAKTTGDRYPELEEAVRRRHTYEVPEILATPVAKGSADYLGWLRSQVSRG